MLLLGFMQMLSTLSPMILFRYSDESFSWSLYGQHKIKTFLSYFERHLHFWTWTKTQKSLNGLIFCFYLEQTPALNRWIHQVSNINNIQAHRWWAESWRLCYVQCFIQHSAWSTAGGPGTTTKQNVFIMINRLMSGSSLSSANSQPRNISFHSL